MPSLQLFLLLLLSICYRLSFSATITTESVNRLASDLSSRLMNVFEGATKSNEITKSYAKLAEPEEFDAPSTLKSIKRQFEDYLRERAKMAWDAKVSLESRDLAELNLTHRVGVNDPLSKDFIRYFNAKKLSDSQTIYLDGHFAGSIEINSTREYAMRQNPNFYGVPTNSETSAVHIPTPIYNRDPHLLERIEWSDVDKLYRRNRERLKDLSFQKFCSEAGFMRYFPAAPWIYDNKEMELDLFDCRSTEWYIDAATMSKNVLILLDLSGSMLGQRLEIAKLTAETILDTLSDNDYFNLMAFSKTTNFVSECTDDKMLQATARNKKLVLSRLDSLNSEGKAEYEKALVKAFTTLMDLPGTLGWRTRDELAKEQREGKVVDPELNYIHLEDHVLVVPDSYIDAIRKFAGNQRKRMGCTDLVMLITDGAPSAYKEIFELYNHDKRIRFFSFLVGEEARDTEQVRWMACHNRGFMAHIASMADVQEKVMQYIRVLSRPVSHQSASIHQENAVWSGLGRERMSNEFIVHISYPVVLDSEFMGVSSVSVPLAELVQLSHPSLLGPKSTFFILDKNGYAMAHPQLRPIDPTSGELKPTFSNSDLAELDGYPADTNKGMPVIDCASEEPTSWQGQSLFALEKLRRVYSQKNNYLAECIAGTPMIVGLSVAEREHARLKRAGHLEPSRVDPNWLRDHNWRLNPLWRYCFLNDSDYKMSHEAAFREYMREMRNSGQWPDLCKARRKLVERVLLDAEATTDFNAMWDRGWKENREHGIHLTFFSTPAGLVRYMNQSLEDYFYEHPDGASENNTELAYKHFVLNLNRESTETEYFKRAVRQRGRIVVDINRQTHMWTDGAVPSSYGNEEKESLLAVAFKALYLDDALVGVVGMEFLFDKLSAWMKSLGCNPEDPSVRCYLLDEHAYVVYTSQKDTRYSDFTQTNMPAEQTQAQRNQVPSKRRKAPYRMPMTAQQRWLGRRRMKGYLPTVVLGSFFGHINRAAEWTMELLIRNGFFTDESNLIHLRRETFIDNQAMCDPEPPPSPQVSPLAASATSAVKPFKYLAQLVIGGMWNLLRVISQLSLIPSSLVDSAGQIGGHGGPSAPPKPVEGGGRRFPCKMRSKFYVANPTKAGRHTPLDVSHSERPCRQSTAQCSMKVFASWVESTNLLLVVVKQGARSQCFDSAHCAMSSPPTLPFGFEKIPDDGLAMYAGAHQGSGIDGDESSSVSNDGAPSTMCLATLPAGRKETAHCLRDDFLEEDESTLCSSSPSLPFTSINAIILMFMAFLVHYFQHFCQSHPLYY